MTDAVEHLDDARATALAVGELTGRERAEALEHLLVCRACRDEVDSLVDVSEEILLLAPEAEPPAGFESAVLERFEFVERAAAPRRRWLAGVAAAVVAGLVAGAVVIGVLAAHDDGPALAESPMVTPSGLEVGSAWSAGSDPSWILVSVPGWAAWDASITEPGEYRLRVELDDGTSAEFGPVTFHDDTGSWATTTSLDTGHIRSVAVVDATGHVWCEAVFGT